MAITDPSILERLQRARTARVKAPYKGPAKQSEKAKAKVAEEKKQRGEDDSAKQKWFKAVRRKLTGTCQCGCARPSSKFDDDNFRSSCCHVFPQRDFESVRYHLLNHVERNFWEGCHTNMDNQSMDKWANMADWDNIKEIFFQLSPLLTDQERATKFYTKFESLVYAN